MLVHPGMHAPQYVGYANSMKGMLFRKRRWQPEYLTTNTMSFRR